MKHLNNPNNHLSDLLDAKSHIRLAEIAQTLLKLSSFDTLTIASRGIQSYFQKLVPFTDWSDEQIRPALNLLLRRLDRMFLKICKKPMIKVRTISYDKTKFFVSLALFRLGSNSWDFEWNLFHD